MEVNLTACCRLAIEKDKCPSVSEKKTALSRRNLRGDDSLDYSRNGHRGDHKSREGHLGLATE